MFAHGSGRCEYGAKRRTCQRDSLSPQERHESTHSFFTQKIRRLASAASIRPEELDLKTKTIHQVVTIQAPPSEVYESLMDSKRHSQFTGCAAKISRRIGGSFTTMASLRGKNVELVPNEKIV